MSIAQAGLPSGSPGSAWQAAYQPCVGFVNLNARPEAACCFACMSGWPWLQRRDLWRASLALLFRMQGLHAACLACCLQIMSGCAFAGCPVCAPRQAHALLACTDRAGAAAQTPRTSASTRTSLRSTGRAISTSCRRRSTFRPRSSSTSAMLSGCARVPPLGGADHRVRLCFQLCVTDRRLADRGCGLVPC